MFSLLSIMWSTILLVEIKTVPEKVKKESNDKKIVSIPPPPPLLFLSTPNSSYFQPRELSEQNLVPYMSPLLAISLLFT